MHLLGLWPERYCTPVYKSVIRESFLERNCPLLVISLINTDHIIKFPEIDYSSIKETDFKPSLSMFDSNDHEQIYHILNQDPLDHLTYDDKLTLWEKRHNLTDVSTLKNNKLITLYLNILIYYRYRVLYQKYLVHHQVGKPIVCFQFIN